MIVTTNPEAYGIDDVGGKSVDHVAWYDVERIPRNKQVMDVVADDGSTYRWTKHRADEPWTFEGRTRPDGSTDTARRQLPQKIDLLVERSPDVIY